MKTLAHEQAVLTSFCQQARESVFTDWWLIFEGDWGGQIYLTVPLSLIGPRARILTLSRKLDDVAWDCNEGEGSSIYIYSPSAITQQIAEFDCDPATDLNHIPGGMGGGHISEEAVWIHEEFQPDMIAEAWLLLDLR
ncbi:MAG: hypothetical protein WCV68_03050 [Candidatus Paceibacterota bacterium]|jgi:hypothetical protein